MRYVLVLSALLALPACDDGDGGSGLTGTYEVTSHTLVEDGCGGEPMPVSDPANCFGCVISKGFFKVKQQNFFGQTVHTIVDCDSAETCDDAENPDEIVFGGAVFERSVGGALVGEVHGAATGGIDCGYTRVDYRLEATDEGVRLSRTERRLKDGTPSKGLTGDDCLDLTDNPPPESELECAEQEVVLGQAPAN